MNELQALVTGMIAGSLARGQLVGLEIEVGVDDDLNYTPEIKVTGLNSGTKLLVTVSVLEE